ncbi:muscarinic acetylcholine receptor M2-like [Hemiscyllium ocellatum]|uniref:muscarinic acetylcholine receptor M2-like n=1 Tax=Hemiscyllium ocellatum TaxID=170820 RepID=UPI002967799D|nr:muscarinic acetylcholine receptor M2-like [Hemiscyllium ocellatum]
MENRTEINVYLSNPSGLLDTGRVMSFKRFELTLIVIATGSLSLVTIIGNILVIVSVIINRQLQTINNYFMFSLACADLIVGAFSMNLYTIYIVIGYWPMGPVVCDIWLAVDYVVSYASVMNLLVISIDRYFCVTKPLSYPLSRTTQRAAIMIATAWMLPFIVFAPPILFWQFITGEQNVSDGECYVQFLSNPAVTFGTTIVAFYLPVTIMVILYIHISRASKCRIKQDGNISKSRKDSVRPRHVMNKLMKIDHNSINNVPHGIHPIKTQSKELPNSSYHRGKKQDFSNKTNSFPTIKQKKQGMMQESLNVPHARSSLRTEIHKLLCLKIARQSENYNCSATKAGIISSISSQRGTIRDITAVDKSTGMTKSPAQKKAVASRELRVTQTVFAIILAFIITWTPYDVIVFIKTFCSNCVPNTVWTIGYWLCYMNSAVNPVCYALCNTNFKKTFKHLLLCQYRNFGATR